MGGVVTARLLAVFTTWWVWATAAAVLLALATLYAMSAAVLWKRAEAWRKHASRERRRRFGARMRSARWRALAVRRWTAAAARGDAA